MNPPGMVRVLPFSYAWSEMEMLFIVSPWTQGRIPQLFDINEQQFPGYNAVAAKNSTVKRELGSHRQSAELNFHPQPHKSHILYAQVNPYSGLLFLQKEFTNKNGGGEF